jgi:tRNA nucleotidyltransferase/poly(A) polymerase
MFEFDDNEIPNPELEKREELLKKELEDNKLSSSTSSTTSSSSTSSNTLPTYTPLPPSRTNKDIIKNTINQENENDDEEDELSSEDIEELKELICNWLDLDEKAKKISDEMKDLKLEKKQYETYILGFMDKANKKVIKTNDNACTLRKDIKETKGSLKEEHILKTLSKILSNSEQAYKITQQIIEELPSKEVISLKKDKNGDKTFKKTKTTKKKDI